MYLHAKPSFGWRRTFGRPHAGASAAPARASAWRTFLIVGLSAIVPVLVLTIVVGYRSSMQQRRAAAYDVTLKMNSAASRLDSILSAQREAAIAAASFRSVRSEEFPKLLEHFQRLLDRHADWAGILLIRPNGDTVIDSRTNAAGDTGTAAYALPPDIQSPTFERPLVGGLRPSQRAGEEATIPIYVPARWDGSLHSVIVVLLRATPIGAVLAGVGLPPDWRGLVVDQDDRVVAGTPNSPFAVGARLSRPPETPGSGTLAADSTQANGDLSTISMARPIEGVGWRIICAIPRALLDKPVNEARWLLLLASGGALGLAIILASLVTLDVAERRRADLNRAEDELRVSEAWRLLALEAADIGTWQWDARDDRFRYCERFRQLMGIGEAKPGRRSALAAIKPEDRRRALLAMVDSYRRLIPFDIELRGQSPDGTIRWRQLCGRPLFNDRNRPIGIYGVIINIDDQKRTEAEHRTLLGRLHSAQEDERRRIARDLHDRVGQAVTGLSLALKRIEVADASPPRRAAYEDLKHMIGEISRDIHRAAVELRPTALDDLGLVDALNAYLLQWQNRSGIGVDACFSGFDHGRVEPFIETTAYRIVVELLTNIAKHAGARSVSVTMTRRSEMMTLVVEDNGCGFDAGSPRRDGHQPLGLMGIRERLELVGGRLTIESAPGRGTGVFVRIPLVGRPHLGVAA